MFDETANGENGNEKPLEVRVEEKVRYRGGITRPECDAMIFIRSGLTLEDGNYTTTRDFMDALQEAGDSRNDIKRYYNALKEGNRGIVQIGILPGRKKWSFWQYHQITPYPSLGGMSPKEFFRERQERARKVLKYVNMQRIISLTKEHHHIDLYWMIETYLTRKGKTGKKDKKILQEAIPKLEELDKDILEKIGGGWEGLNLKWYNLKENLPRYWKLMETFAKEKTKHLPKEWQQGTIDPKVAKEWVENWKRGRE